MKPQPLFRESEWFESYDVVVGIDEVGRGPVAGPLCAAAIALSPRVFENWHKDTIIIRDSKKMSQKQRETAHNWLSQQPIHVSYVSISASDIDEKGIAWANKTAMQQALDECLTKIEPVKRVLVISDHVHLTTTHDHQSFPKAEDSSCSVACASIWAKCTRDEYMKEIDRIYPNYGFASHVGYGTTKHLAAIQLHGITPEHRRSFLKKYLSGL